MMCESVESKSRLKVLLDEEELIRQIATRPILYDRSLKAYRKLSLRHQYWQEVAEAMNVSVEDCRRRWRSLRDSFNKRHKQPNRPQIKWPFYKQMSFIAPYLDNASGEIDEQLLNDFADNSEDAGDVSSLEMTTSLGDVALQHEDSRLQIEQSRTLITTTDLHTSEACAAIDSSHLPTTTTTTTSKTKPVTEDVYQMQEDLSANNQIAQSDPDSNEKFLLSCAPVLRRLSARKNALVRLKIQQLLFEIEFDAHEGS